MTRKQALFCHAAMFLCLLLAMLWSRQTEKYDIAAVRAEQRAYSSEIIAKIESNNQSAIQRSGKISGGIQQLIGRVDSLTLELTRESGNIDTGKRQPDGNRR